MTIEHSLAGPYGEALRLARKERVPVRTALLRPDGSVIEEYIATPQKYGTIVLTIAHHTPCPGYWLFACTCDPIKTSDWHDPPKFCRNCGDLWDSKAVDAALRKEPSGWRPCPNPSPGRPLIDCGVGGHMYDVGEPRAS